MYSVMLVEDEQTQREGLRKYVPWEKLGFRVEAEAEDSDMALERIHGRKMDVVVLDLHMKGTSGLDFLRKIREAGMKTQVIVLTGYNDFEYVRTALQYKAVDYLLKPVKIKELVSLLGKIKDELDDEINLQFARSADERTVLEFKLFQLFHSHQARVDATGWLDRFYEKYPDCKAQLLYFLTRMSSQALVREILEKRIGQMPAGCHHFLISKQGYGYIVLSAWPAGQSAAWKKDDLEALSGIPNMVKIVATPLMDQRTFRRRFIRLLDLDNLQSSVFFSEQPVVELVADTRLPDASAEADRKLDTRPIADALKELNRERLTHLLGDIYFSIKSSVVWSVHEANLQYERLLVDVSLLLESLHIPGQWIEEIRCAHQEIRRFRTLRSLHDHVVRALLGLLERMKTDSAHKNNRIIQEIKRHVDQHLAESIMLSDLADKYGVSSAYLSQLFKKEEGINFNQYLQQVRIRKAIEYMNAHPAARIYEVAERVGYQDPKHFSKVFREQTRKSPKQYTS